jgi:hypothetical protein
MVTRALLKTVGISALLALGACMHMQTETQAAPPVHAQVVAASPSPRPECASAHVTLYFTDQVASDEPVVTPLLNDFMERIHACQAAGGELRSITIDTVADPNQSASDGRAQVARRQARVRTALVNAGAPADKIVNGSGHAQEGAIMGRRAEINADLY